MKPWMHWLSFEFHFGIGKFALRLSLGLMDYHNAYGSAFMVQTPWRSWYGSHIVSTRHDWAERRASS